MKHTNEQTHARSYFLGELAAAEQCALEEKFFLDEQFSRFLDETEEQLINDYVRGRLGRRQRRNFESRYLVSGRRFELVRTAENALNSRPVFLAAPTRPSFWQNLVDLFRSPSMAFVGGLAVMVPILLAALWVSFRIQETGDVAEILVNSEAAATAIPTSLPVENRMPPENLPAAGDPSEVSAGLPKYVRSPRRASRLNAAAFATALPPISERTDEPLAIKAGKGEPIRLQIARLRSGEFVKYRAEIHAADGDLIWSREIPAGRSAARKPLALEVRSGALVSGTYELTISGATGDGQLEEIDCIDLSVKKIDLVE